MKETPIMTTVQPEGEDLRKAVKWISEERKYDPEAKTSRLIEEACLKFDLSPMDAEYLLNFLKAGKD
jgi:hypothetical protein